MPEPQAAVAILHAGGAADSVLLIRRTVRPGDPWSGHWSFPGGRCDPQDSGLLDTALRELREECGIGLAGGQLEAAMEPSVAGRTGGRSLLVAPFLFRVDRELPTELQAAEAACSAWVPLRLLRDPSRHCLRPVPGRPPGFLFPCVDLPGAPLWGFTYRLLTRWLGLTAEDSPGQPAGFRVASALGRFLTGCGLTVRRAWNGRELELNGTIPAAAVMERFCAPGAFVESVNMLAVQPREIRLLGLRYEEYRILAVE